MFILAFTPCGVRTTLVLYDEVEQPDKVIKKEIRSTYFIIFNSLILKFLECCIAFLKSKKLN